jgi:hypothetical protein
LHDNARRTLAPTPLKASASWTLIC